MAKKGVIICSICVIVGIIFVNLPQKPRLISSITTMDTAYLTILAAEPKRSDLEKLKNQIIYLCRTDGFQEIKLQTKDKQQAKKYYISVYFHKADLKNGKEGFSFMYEEENPPQN